MTSNRPYLVRALYEWICDNGMTPYLLVEATAPGVRVPPQTVKDGRVVLNIAPRAVTKLELANDVVSFQARFAGVAMLVIAPTDAILAVYAMENGQGMLFPPVDATVSAGDDDAPEPAVGDTDADGTPPTPSGDRPSRGSHLRVVK
jgi:stringent starvation protein B